MSNKIIVRTAGRDDIDVLVNISQKSVVPPWSAGNFADAIQSNLCKVVVGESDGTVCGYIVCYHAADEGEIPQVAVAESFRRKGIASSMMEMLFDKLRDDGICRLFLEVRERNAVAIKLYERMGFLSVGVRKDFYTNPKEDAVIMMRDINA